MFFFSALYQTKVVFSLPCNFNSYIRKLVSCFIFKIQFCFTFGFQVFYYLGELNDSLSYALGAGPLFDVSEDSDFVHTLLGKNMIWFSLIVKCYLIKQWYEDLAWGIASVTMNISFHDHIIVHILSVFDFFHVNKLKFILLL